MILKKGHVYTDTEFNGKLFSVFVVLETTKYNDKIFFIYHAMPSFSFKFHEWTKYTSKESFHEI